MPSSPPGSDWPGQPSIRDRRPRRTAGLLCRIAGGSDFGLVAFSLGDVGVDQHETAARHRVVTDFDHPSIWSGALIGSGLPRLFDEPTYVLLRVPPGAILTTIC